MAVSFVRKKRGALEELAENSATETNDKDEDGRVKVGGLGRLAEEKLLSWPGERTGG